MVLGAMVAMAKVVQFLKNFILTVLDVINICHDHIVIFIPVILENFHLHLNILKMFSDGIHGAKIHDVTWRVS